MPAFSINSKKRLEECHPDLQKIMNIAIKDFDFSVLCGHRGREEQEAAFNSGNSKAQFGKSKHNFTPSLAIDIAPYPIDWDNIERFVELSKLIKKIAAKENIKIIYGGDWASLKDYPHYELA